MGRLMPTECAHGRIRDWGDFGDEDGSPPEPCPECDVETDRIRRLADAEQAVVEPSKLLEQVNQSLDGALVTIYTEDHVTLLDDIVVKNVTMFRAEAMGDGEWFVCCYLDDATGDRIAWHVGARCRPRRIEWTTTEFPEPHHVYEHTTRRRAVAPPHSR